MNDLADLAKAKSAEAFDAAFKSDVPMAAQNHQLTAEQRAHLRKLITTHAGWPAYRLTWQIDASALDRRRVLHFCETHAIDWHTALVTLAEQTQSAAPTPADAERKEEERANREQRDRVLAEEEARVAKRKADTARQQTTLEAQRAAPPAPVLPAPTAPVPSFSGDAITSAIAGVLWTPLLDAVRQDMERAIDAKVGTLPTTIIEVRRLDGSTSKLPATHHPMLPTLIKALSTPMASGYYPNVWIAGPTGSGKTHAAHQVAEALGLPFHSQGSMSMPHELLGYQDGHGVYHGTSFRDAYEHGGVMLLDEIDGGDNSAILAINGATANGSCRFPDKVVHRHKDFRLIGAANTWGQGATAEYIGRAKIDSAILSRFPVKLAWNYDIAFEARICGDDAKTQAWVKRVQDARRRAEANKIKVVIDPRVSQAGAALIAAGFTADEAATMTYLAGLKPEQVQQIEGKTF